MKIKNHNLSKKTNFITKSEKKKTLLFQRPTGTPGLSWHKIDRKGVDGGKKRVSLGQINCQIGDNVF